MKESGSVNSVLLRLFHSGVDMVMGMVDSSLEQLDVGGAI